MVYSALIHSFQDSYVATRDQLNEALAKKEKEAEVLKVENELSTKDTGPVIVHCADLHLDSPFSCFSAESSKAKTLREEQLSVLGRIILLARKTGAAFLLIAGDLFDA